MRTRALAPHVDPTALLLVACWLVAVPVAGSRSTEDGVLPSLRSESDFALTADPEAPHWKGVAGVVAETDRQGRPVPGHRTEIRSRWTATSLYLLFVCPYEELHLKPHPATDDDTPRLWDWDVAEAFIGTDHAGITRYKEFQVSPQGERVDLAIDLGVRPARYDAGWDSGFAVEARIDRAARTWYGEMRIPMKALGVPAPVAGLEMRANLYRIQGPHQRRRHVNWRPVMSRTFHTPAAFGRIRLED